MLHTIFIYNYYYKLHFYSTNKARVNQRIHTRIRIRIRISRVRYEKRINDKIYENML